MICGARASPPAFPMAAPLPWALAHPQVKKSFLNLKATPKKTLQTQQNTPVVLYPPLPLLPPLALLSIQLLPKTHLPRARGFPSPPVSGFGLFFLISFPPPHSGPHRFSPEPPSWPPCLRLCVTQIIMLPSYLKLSESLIPIR